MLVDSNFLIEQLSAMQKITGPHILKNYMRM